MNILQLDILVNGCLEWKYKKPVSDLHRLSWPLSLVTSLWEQPH